MKAGLLAGRQASAAFDVLADISWHSVFWTDGPNFVAEGYADSDPITVWPNETSEGDAFDGATAPTYDAVAPLLNNAPAARFTGTGDKEVRVASFSSAPTQPYSIVVVAEKAAGGTGDQYICDSTQRTIIGEHTSGVMGIFAGTWLLAASEYNADEHLFVGVFNGASSEFLVDNTVVASGNAGTATPSTNFTIGNRYTPSAAANDYNGAIAFLGIYDGDITAHGQWSNFVSWVTTTYGI